MSIGGDAISRLLGSLDCTWHWQWVPNARPGEPARQEWTEQMVGLFADWASDDLEVARRSWPKDADAEFPLSADMVGQATAELLLDRAGQLPAFGRLAWGAAFLSGQVRWAPVPVVVQFHQPREEDPNYLMEVVAATGRDGDARQPVMDYVSTSAGDGVRVSALARAPEGAVFGRVDAALRLDVPPSDGAERGSVDVMFATQVFDLGLMAVIGAGVEELMRLVADESVPAGDGVAHLSFAAAAAEAQP